LNHTFLFEPVSFEVQITIENVKMRKSPDIDQIPIDLIRAGSET
jgi:hypothetical protein